MSKNVQKKEQKMSNQEYGDTVRVVTAPEKYRDDPPANPLKPTPSIFLAGSIEQDKAERWQEKVIQALQDANIGKTDGDGFRNPEYRCTFFNPRRSNWNANLPQDKLNEELHIQVNWELDALDRADIIVMYFDPKTIWPISLLEMGLYAQQRKLLVCCPEGYFRKGNVDIVCERHGVPQVRNLGELINRLKKEVKEFDRCEGGIMNTVLNGSGIRSLGAALKNTVGNKAKQLLGFGEVNKSLTLQKQREQQFSGGFCTGLGLGLAVSAVFITSYVSRQSKL